MENRGAIRCFMCHDVCYGACMPGVHRANFVGERACIWCHIKNNNYILYYGKNHVWCSYCSSYSCLRIGTAI